MYEDKVIKQDSDKNILWQVFRNLTEEIIIPNEMDKHNFEFIEKIMRNKR